MINIKEIEELLPSDKYPEGGREKYQEELNLAVANIIKKYLPFVYSFDVRKDAVYWLYDRVCFQKINNEEVPFVFEFLTVFESELEQDDVKSFLFSLGIKSEQYFLMRSVLEVLSLEVQGRYLFVALDKFNK